MSEESAPEVSGNLVGLLFCASLALHIGMSAWLRFDAGLLDAWGIVVRTFGGGWDPTSYPELGAFVINQEELSRPLLVAWIALALVHLTVAYGLPEIRRKLRGNT